MFSNPFELFGTVVAAFAIDVIALAGTIRWIEGLLLVGIYALLAPTCFVD